MADSPVPPAPGASPPPPSSLLGEIRRLGTNSVTYLLPTVLVRGLNFLLVPLYARMMPPEDYGIVGLAATLTPLVTTVSGCYLQSAASRLHFDFPDDRGRGQLYSTILLFMLAVPFLATLGLEAAGRAGLLDVFASISFDPHLRLIIWTGFFGVFPGLVVHILVAREAARRLVAFNLSMVVVTIALNVLFVVVLRRGALGQLWAGLLAGAVMAVTTVVLVSRWSGFHFSPALLKRALAFAVPLVPHQLANWALAVADRLLLERFVDRGDLGRYTLAYTLASLTAIVSGAVNMAFFPLVTRKLGAGDPEGQVPRLGTLALVPTVMVALAVALVAGDLIRIFFAPPYHPAADLVPLIGLGLVFQGLYNVWSQGTLFSKKTRLVPLVTATGAAVNIGLNLWLVPRIGVLAAALNTAIGYAVLALLHGYLAHRLYPIAWEYGRWLRLGLCAALTYVAGVALVGGGPVAALLWRVVLLATLFPGLLILTNVVPRRLLMTHVSGRLRPPWTKGE